MKKNDIMNVIKSKLYLIFYFYLIQILAFLVVKMVLKPLLREEFYLLVETQLALIVSLIILCFFIAYMFEHKRYKEKIGIIPLNFPSFKISCLVVFASVLFFFVFYIVAVFLNIEIENQTKHLILLSQSPYTAVPLFIGMCIAAPIIEEILFRGWLVSRLLSLNIDKKLIISSTSTLFMVMHIQYNQFFNFVYLFSFSVVLCNIRLKTNNILYCILSHSTLNFLVFASLYFL